MVPNIVLNNPANSIKQLELSCVRAKIPSTKRHNLGNLGVGAADIPTGMLVVGIEQKHADRLGHKLTFPAKMFECNASMA